jgi:GT2 family glycosyltransferase
VNAEDTRIAGPEQDTDKAVTVDVVIVSYNSHEHLREAAKPFTSQRDIHVVVVDNASIDGSLSALAGLPVETIPLDYNSGFAHGCNRGWTAGGAPYILFLNPDARLQAADLRRLVEVLEREPTAGVVAPRIVDEHNSIDFSIRRFPRLRSAYGQAFFLQRLFPTASWVDEVIRDPAAYERSSVVEWISGACMLVRREVLEQVGGWDEGFFLYCEDIDLCKRIRDAGFEVRYESGCVAVHRGGASGSRAALLPTLAESRLRYARKHRKRGWQLLERIGFALGALTHVVVSKGGLPPRLGHARAFTVLASGKSPPRP